jgi:pimeloyl-ACP methyl ester carboxylesterase
VLCAPAGAAAADPDPAETAKRDVELADEWDGTPAGVVGWLDGGRVAVELAASHPDLVDRLVLVSTPIPSLGEPQPPAVSAKTLLLYGSKDAAGATGRRRGGRIGSAGAIEMVPGAGSDILVHVWPRVFSFLAPRSLRRAGG